jgi:drug/metabolite transporter (DMT)-like permease
MTHARGVALLLLTTLIWGTTFPAIKVATAALAPGQLVALRFGVALLALGWFLSRATWRTWLHGGLTGILAAVSYIALAQGMTTTGSARSGFLIGLNVILVPLALPLLGRRLTVAAMFGALLAATGLAALAWDASAIGLSIGDWWVIVSAVGYAAYILMMDRYVTQHDSRAFSGTQVAAVFVLSLAWSGAQGTAWPQLQGSWPLVVLYLGVCATALTTWTQVLGQRVVPPVQTAVIYALEPVFAAGFSALLLHEHLRRQDLLGGALIVAGMIVCMLPQRAEGVVGRVAT